MRRRIDALRTSYGRSTAQNDGDNESDDQYSEIQKLGHRATRSISNPRPHVPQSLSSGDVPHGDFHAELQLRPMERHKSVANSSFSRIDQSLDILQAQDPLGLNLVHDNENPTGDIIFVHGLGGTSIRTWSFNRDERYFWPPWLAETDELSTFRIFTMGYDANFRGGSVNLNTIDFSKSLLHEMLTFLDGKPIGSVPIIFVAHSMGGLVVKKAFVLGQHHDKYSIIISQVRAMLFLGTPHQGSSHSRILNTILKSMPGGSAKGYIAELDVKESSLQDLNEHFSRCSRDLHLVSFFETNMTSIGHLTKVMIVEKENARMGLPNEECLPLLSDHHSISKFPSQQDRNYETIRKTLAHWASEIRASMAQSSLVKRQLQLNQDREKVNAELSRLESSLGIRERPEADLDVLGARILDGTCQWIFEKKNFREWYQKTSTGPIFYWLMAPPATGKTSLARSVVSHFQSQGQLCAYHFFSAGHQLKRAASYCLRSIAFQLAKLIPDFRERLFSLIEESGMQFNTLTQGFDIIWDQVFKGILAKIRFDRPIYMVLDGIDEADSEMFVSVLAELKSPIKFFFTSRPMKLFPVSPDTLSTCFMNKNDTAKDIRSYVQIFIMRNLSVDPRLREEIVNDVLGRAEGSFLWVKLALNKLKKVALVGQIRKTLDEIPEGMASLYQDMLHNIQSESELNRLLVKRILTWVLCSFRPLTIPELVAALEPEFGQFFDMEDTIYKLCHHFVSVDNSKVTIIHDTARTFLLDKRGDEAAYISLREGHELLAVTCLCFLSYPRVKGEKGNSNWREVLKADEFSRRSPDPALKQNKLANIEKQHPLLTYTVVFWSYHVAKSSPRAETVKSAVETFLQRDCLSWIEMVAVLENLKLMTRAAQLLKAYAKKTFRGSNEDLNGSLLSLKEPAPSDFSILLERWAVDFVHICSMLGQNLLQQPSSIYQIIPQLCPPRSVMNETYGVTEDNMLSVIGRSSYDWGDTLARVDVGGNENITQVLATERYFLTLVLSGTVVVWDAITCVESRRFAHSEPVSIMAVNKSGTLLATSGTESFRIWEVSTGKELYRYKKTNDPKTLDMGFNDVANELVIALNDCSVMRYNLETGKRSYWDIEDAIFDKNGCAVSMNISPDTSRLAIAWRGKEVLVYDMLGSTKPLQCPSDGFGDPVQNPNRVLWHPSGDRLIIHCYSSTIAQWDLRNVEGPGKRKENLIYYDDRFSEPVNAITIKISKDGNYLLAYNGSSELFVWAIPRVHLLYKVVCKNEFIQDIEISPSGDRFYDTRESACNVWEPDVLVRPDERDMEDTSSIGESYATTAAVISQDMSSENWVTAIAVAPDGLRYCVGREDGSVVICSTADNDVLRRLYRFQQNRSVGALTWSPSGRFIAASDKFGLVATKRIELKNGQWAYYPGVEVAGEQAPRQLIFSNNDRLLLISYQQKDVVWDLKAKQEVCSAIYPTYREGKWFPDPINSDMILWVSPTTICPYRWTTLQCSEPNHPTSAVQPASSGQRQIRNVAVTKDKRNIVYEIVSHQSSISVMMLSTSSLAHSWHLPSDLSSRVRMVVGAHHDRVVFLDHDYWLCTWEIDTHCTDVKKHFFLPKDWLNADTLKIATINELGMFFCPRFGEVFVVKNGMKL